MAPRTREKSGKQPTINDVAALAGVSKKTVSRVINRSEFITDKTRQAVEQAIKMLGFVPNPQARALAFRRNFLIALLHDNPNAQTVLNFQQGVLDAIKDSDLALLVRPVDRGSDRLLDDVRTFLEKQRPIGALLLPPISENDDLAALCEELGVRYVRVGSAPLDDVRHCVSSNDREVVAEAVGKLVELGHRPMRLWRRLGCRCPTNSSHRAITATPRGSMPARPCCRSPSRRPRSSVRTTRWRRA
jgi:LacI family transcriptional regulator